MSHSFINCSSVKTSTIWFKNQTQNQTCNILIKRELFAFSVVFEFPKDSNIIFALIMSWVWFDPQKNFSRNFEVSVLPEPESPDIMIDCGMLIFFLISFAKLNICAGNTSLEAFRYFSIASKEYNSSIALYGFTAISTSDIYVWK